MVGKWCAYNYREPQEGEALSDSGLWSHPSYESEPLEGEKQEETKGDKYEEREQSEHAVVILV